ncbi:hypothetical protein L9F63_004878, partial [Diploptera punctata]
RFLALIRLQDGINNGRERIYELFVFLSRSLRCIDLTADLHIISLTLRLASSAVTQVNINTILFTSMARMFTFKISFR